MSHLDLPSPPGLDRQLDWERGASGANTSLPPAGPTTKILLDRLPPLPDGGVVLDLACGNGQPSFVLARSRPALSVLGIDATPGLIAEARRIAENNRVENARFEVMSLDRLTLPDLSADAAVSHFGLLGVGDIRASATELARVLKPGAPFSLTVFDDMATNTLMSSVAAALEPLVPAETMPPLDYLSRLGAPGLRERVLTDAGFEDLASEAFTWSVSLPSFDALWGAATRPVPFVRPFGSLDAAGAEAFRTALRRTASAYALADGGYAFPMTSRVLSGRRSSV
jgi:SAM-dependent methyltransferase